MLGEIIFKIDFRDKSCIDFKAFKLESNTRIFKENICFKRKKIIFLCP